MKHEAYRDLVMARQHCRACQGLRNPAEPDLAVYDTGEIGPWSRLHGDLNARLMIVGQDWGDTRYYCAHQGLDDLKNPTMRTLERLLGESGIPAAMDRYGQGNCGVFLTNAILCLKDGGLQAAVDDHWFRHCGPRFLRPQIELVAPRVVVALGQRAHESILHAYGLKVRAFRDAVASPDGHLLPNGSRLLAVYHCGNRILNTHRKYPEQLHDWQRVARWVLAGSPAL